MDLGTTIEPKSDQLNADDLILGPMTIRINSVKGSATPQQPIDLCFDGDHGKPYKPCKSMRRVLVNVWGRDGTAYIGRSLTLYRDDKVRFGGVDVGGIRISHMSGITEPVTLALTASKTSRKPFTVRPLTTEPNTPTEPAVKAAGDEAAKGGVESYKTWLAGLDPDVKETVKWLHTEWSRLAKAADAERSADHADPTIHDRPENADTDSDTADEPMSDLDRKRMDCQTLLNDLDKRVREQIYPPGSTLIRDMDEAELDRLITAVGSAVV